MASSLAPVPAEKQYALAWGQSYEKDRKHIDRLAEGNNPTKDFEGNEVKDTSYSQELIGMHANLLGKSASLAGRVAKLTQKSTDLNKSNDDLHKVKNLVESIKTKQIELYGVDSDSSLVVQQANKQKNIQSEAAFQKISEGLTELEKINTTALTQIGSLSEACEATKKHIDGELVPSLEGAAKKEGVNLMQFKPRVSACSKLMNVVSEKLGNISKTYVAMTTVVGATALAVLFPSVRNQALSLVPIIGAK